MKIGIIGGGAAGMLAAFGAASQDTGAQIEILERNDLLGKKLLSTGNGHCNLTNLTLDVSLYRGSGAKLVPGILREFGVEDTIRFFERIGISCIDRDGYVYPRSREAKAVRSVLSRYIKEIGITVRTGCLVTGIRREPDGFTVICGSEKSHYDRLIICCGGMAAPKTGSDGCLFSCLADLGTVQRPFLPALVPLAAEESYCSLFAGIRADASVTLLLDGQPVRTEKGEVQFTDSGISGIAVFQLSGEAIRAQANGKSVQISVDLFADADPAAMRGSLVSLCRAYPGRKAEQLLTGYIPEKMHPVLLRLAGIRREKPIGELKEEDILRLTEAACSLPFTICGSKGFDAAQVSTGGLLPERDLQLLPGLFAAGEAVDVDGPCGGYNLQWAWSSGYIAGRNAAILH